MAFNSLRSNKTRTFLTLLGIIIGVMSVTTIIGLGRKGELGQQVGGSGGCHHDRSRRLDQASDRHRR